MSWDCPVFPIDAKNSIGFLVQFFLSYAPLVGDSVVIYMPDNYMEIAHHRTYIQKLCLFITDQTPHMGILSGKRPQKALLLNDHF